jgi:REP element-mobilizing transposase RayT
MKLFPGKPPRATQENAPYFLTFCTLWRRPILHLPGIPEFLIDELHFYSARLSSLVGYTIMPDHVHVIVEVETVKNLSAFLRDFKSYTSKEIKKRLSCRQPPGVEGNTASFHFADKPTGSCPLQLDRIWQPGTMDHWIRMNWESKDYENHLSYLFYNSQKHLGIAPKNFLYHNLKEFVHQGYFDEDFCSVGENVNKSFVIYE